MQRIILYYGFFICLLAAMPSCKQGSKKDAAKTVAIEEKAKASRSYDLADVDERFMKKKLKEVSGIHYSNGEQFVAIQDEQGIIYTVDFESAEVISELPFGGAGDYEDITMDAANYYVLESNGSIHRVPKNGNGQGTKVFSFPKAKNEFETIYLDDKGKNLIIICKQCDDDAGGTVFNAYPFDLAKEQFNDAPLFAIRNSGSAKTAGGKRSVFRPSAAAIHPVEKKLYVLCSVGKTLLVCDLQGNIEDQYRLEGALYQQPEGIAFKPNGDLFISNEAGNSRANILKIVYNSR